MINDAYVDSDVSNWATRNV